VWLLEIAIVPLIAVELAAGQFASGVNLVEVYATVVGADGGPIAGLTASDFQVSEDGVAQRMTTFATGDAPLSIAIALDRSFSMRGEPLREAKRAAAAVIAALRPDDEVTVLAVGSEVETLAPPAPARAAAAIRWETIDPWGATLLYDAAMEAIAAAQQRHGRRALLLISDGVDRGSATSAAQLIDRARRSDVLIYPVAIARGRPPVFAELAAVTGGRSIAIGNPEQAESLVTPIVRELRTQYLLGYVPARAPGADPAWHAIDVSVERPNVRVRARDGYYGR
jgi:Ca-activated chloride channel homolog